MGATDICMIILAILLPPVAVVLRRGCGIDLVINILLTLCGHIPGAIHAVYLVVHDRERKRAPAQLYPQQNQTNAQTQYGGQQTMYGNREPAKEPAYGQPMNYEQPQPAPMPPHYSDYTERDIAGNGPSTGEKHEYMAPMGPPPSQAYATKEV